MKFLSTIILFYFSLSLVHSKDVTIYFGEPEFKGLSKDTVLLLKNNILPKITSVKSKLRDSYLKFSDTLDKKTMLYFHIVFIYDFNNGMFQKFNEKQYSFLIYAEDLFTKKKIQETMSSASSLDFGVLEKISENELYNEICIALSCFDIPSKNIIPQKINKECNNNIIITSKSSKYNKVFHQNLLNSFISKATKYKLGEICFNIYDGNKSLPTADDKEKTKRFDKIEYSIEYKNNKAILTLKFNEEYIIAESDYYKHDNKSKTLVIELDKKRIKNNDFIEFMYKINSAIFSILWSNF